MNDALEGYGTSLESAAGLPWHKPQVLRLVINLDTDEAKGGSSADGPGAFDLRGSAEPD